MADAVDSKSTVRKNLWVQVPFPGPFLIRRYALKKHPYRVFFNIYFLK